MSHTVTAIYEHGVLRPTEPLPLQESEEVTIKIVPMDSWQANFNRLLEKIHRASGEISATEIDEDIVTAIRETRAQKHDR